jgi:enoyl-CoA hydratase
MNQLTKRHDGLLAWIGLSSANNTISSGLVEELNSALEKYVESPDSKALIIYGEGEKFFSPGLDLHEVSRFDHSEMSELMRAFTQLQLKLFTYPKPVMAMINGHALAGGFLLASCCDLRFGRKGIRDGPRVGQCER